MSAGGEVMDRLNPIFPAKAGTQIQPERLEMTRLLPRPNPPRLAGSIWAPAFAGESGEGLR